MERGLITPDDAGAGVAGVDDAVDVKPAETSGRKARQPLNEKMKIDVGNMVILDLKGRVNARESCVPIVIS